jgi:phenylalanyl-tRNA synthetase beta chain
MLIPLSWLKDFVEIDIPVEVLAERLTLAGLEIGEIRYIGLPQNAVEGVRVPPSDHLVWDREKLVLGAIREVKPHPDADRLVLAMVDYGGAELEQCVTGAPNLASYKGQGPIEPPLWTAFAHEGAEVWDGHSDTPKRMILKERALRGIPNRSMVCSEKELGISEEHDGIILLDHRADYVAGTPLQDVLGDVVFDIELTPNLARCFSVLGVAREVAALLNKPITLPNYDFLAEGPAIDGQVTVTITEPTLNSRFTAALLTGTKVQPSPQWLQDRLRLVGQRPINNVVDITNYITFELGQPLHAYDFDKLKARASSAVPALKTRLAQSGETLETLDEVTRTLQDFNVLVTDEAGILGLAGIIGGAETEISDDTVNVLLEGANWNFINVRRTMQAQKVHTDAGTRFSRGVHPSQTILGVQRGIELMRQTGGGQIAQGLIDLYPEMPETVTVDLPKSELKRLLGVDLGAETSADLLKRLGFAVDIQGDTLHVTVPDHRMDIDSEPVIGRADIVEEITRIYGYDNIPTTIIADEMPPQHGNLLLDREERTRDLLVALGLYENICYRLTTPEREAQLRPNATPDALETYVQMANPITPDRTVMRHTLLVNLLANGYNNARFNPRQAIFEIGSVYLQDPAKELPHEALRLGIVMAGPRTADHWQQGQSDPLMDFYDIKGVVEGLLHGLHISEASFQKGDHPTFHPGRSAQLVVGNEVIGTFGELHPLVAQAFELTNTPIMAAELNLEALLKRASDTHTVTPLPVMPPVLQDIALVVKAEVSAADVEAAIIKGGGYLLKQVSLFDVYTGGSIPEGHKSLAYKLTYQTDEKTLTDKEVAKVHQRIVKTAEREVGATLRA